MLEIDDIIKTLLDDPYDYAMNSSIDDLVELLKQLSQHYYTTEEPLVSDSVYDILRDALEDRDPSNAFLGEVGTPISKDKVDLPYPMPSLNKIKPTTDNLANWLKDHDGPFILSDKLDGISGLLYKKDNKFRLFTRGDSTTGQDITHLIPYILKNKYKPGKIPNGTAIRGEIVMSKSNFLTIKDKYKNARNTIAGLVNSKHPDTDIANITDFIGYAIIHPKLTQQKQMEKLKEWEFPCVEYKIKKELTNDDLGKYFQERRKDAVYDIDGIVVVDSREAYDVNNKNPTYGFAFKMVLSDQVTEATVLNIEWNISKHGYIKPIVKIKPVDLVGVTIKNLTAFNAKYVVDNVLGPGAVIKIVRSGDVIPYILKVLKPSTSGEAQMPDIPYVWNETKIDIIVKDVHGAAKDAIAIKQISDFFKVLGVKFISEGIVTKLVDNGYNTLHKILTAKISDMSKIDGIGDKVLNKIFTNIRDAFDTTNLETLMSASNTFGRGLGVRKLKVIIDKYPNIMNETWDKGTMTTNILELDGFDIKTTNQFINGLEKFKIFYAELEKIETINVKHLKTPKQKQVNEDNNTFDLMKIVFTGFRDKKLEEYIVSHKGQISSTVSKNTTLVIYISDDGSAKYKKAVELGIKMMTKDQFIIEYKIPQ